MKTIKITIKPGSEADKAVKALQEQQKQFREAIESGKVEDYARKQAFAVPVPKP